MDDKWVEKAACIGEGTDVFFTDSQDRGENLRREAKAKNICRKCEVAAECLLHAISNNEDFGIWGSFAPKERRTLKTLFKDIDIQLCKSIVNKELRSIKARMYRGEI